MQQKLGVTERRAYKALEQSRGAQRGRPVALSINGRKWPVDSVTRKILEGFGLSIGVPAAAVKQSFEEIRRRVRAAAPIIAMRYDRCAHTFFSAIGIAAIVIYWL